MFRLGLVLTSLILGSISVNPFVDLSINSISSINADFVVENKRELNNIKNRHKGNKEPNTWVIGDDGKWVAYDNDLNLVKGLIYDKDRDSYFLTGFKSGNLVYKNGLYIINDKIVHLTFSSNRTGKYGKIDSGVNRLKSIIK